MDARAFDMFVKLLGTLTGRQMSKVVGYSTISLNKVKRPQFLRKLQRQTWNARVVGLRGFAATVKRTGLTDIGAETVRRPLIR